MVLNVISSRSRYTQTTKLEISAKKDIGHWSHCSGYKEEKAFVFD